MQVDEFCVGGRILCCVEELCDEAEPEQWDKINLCRKNNFVWGKLILCGKHNFVKRFFFVRNQEFYVMKIILYGRTEF